MRLFQALATGDQSAERVVPPTGWTTYLVLVSAAAMAFLAIFVLTLALTADRQADDWERALSDTATVRISAPADQIEADARAVEVILSQTPGIGATRRLSDEEQRALLEPWFGPDLPVDALRLPVLIEVQTSGEGPDPEGLMQRFAAEAPGAIYDDHGRWRTPMIDAANSLRRLAFFSLVLIAGVTAITLALAASAAIAANAQVIEVLRLVGAEDSYITRAFVRRFTLRALIGALAGTLLGLVAVALVPNIEAGGLAADMGLNGLQWLWPFLVPILAAVLAYVSTRVAAAQRLREVS